MIALKFEGKAKELEKLFASVFNKIFRYGNKTRLRNWKLPSWI